MKILHTADWHIGQAFYAYDRAYEHEQFFAWLLQTLQKENIDVLLVSGDIFDTANPSAASQALFYRFLKNAELACPELQMVITAGNHDSAARLESPKPLLEASRVHIIGFVSKDEAGNIDYEKLCVPLRDRSGATVAWCLAVPFLRLGDYPMVSGSENTYAAGVAALYSAAVNYVQQKMEKGQSLIGMGHLHAHQAALSDMDRQERLIMGGVEGIPVTAFPDELAYVALGHIHKAQKVGGKEHIRYSGSPIPMSFSEINYKHQVVVFQIASEGPVSMDYPEIPVAIPLLKVPKEHRPLAEVLLALEGLPAVSARDIDLAPYLEVCVLSDGPEPGLRHQVEKVLSGKYARLAKIDVRYRKGGDIDGLETEEEPRDKLEQLQPVDVFEKTYQAKFGVSVPEKMLELFRQAAQECNSQD